MFMFVNVVDLPQPPLPDLWLGRRLKMTIFVEKLALNPNQSNMCYIEYWFNFFLIHYNKRLDAIHFEIRG